MMEPKTLDESEPIEDEDLPRSSSYSSASSASAISELSFDDSRNISRNHSGSLAQDHELSQRDLAREEESGSDANDDPRVGSSALESPPSQVMERTPHTSGYRIPSHVFARNKSNTPNPEWSTCSNESLFSIHPGNMSFMRDQYSWMYKSGELGMYVPDMNKSGELGYQGDLDKASTDEPKIEDTCLLGESPEKSAQVCELGEQVTTEDVNNFSSSPKVLVEASKVCDVMRTPPRASDASLDTGVPSKKEGSKRKGGTPSVDETEISTRVSHHSNASGQSFAFPLLEEIDGEKSVNSRRSQVDRSKETSTANEEQKAPKSTPQKATSASSSSWFSCFSCCS